MSQEEREEVLGLQYLLQRGRVSAVKMWDSVTPLETHPFGMERRVPPHFPALPGELPDPLTERINYLGDPGVTSTSIEVMAGHLLNRLAHVSVVYLRVIMGRIHPEDYHDLRPRHEVYYEVGLPTGEVLISGGCNDFSGGGKSGKAEMDIIFAFLAHHFHLEIETAWVQISAAASGRKYIEDRLNAAV